jgi:hypothetical protein
MCAASVRVMWANNRFRKLSTSQFMTGSYRLILSTGNALPLHVSASVTNHLIKTGDVLDSYIM